ncbi:MAG TPA: Rrf2 family transcriptional regulator [Chitinispirillaceae bacterium]|nr:Rrf2 family transcriptional regulator [Chitinispirillaceae bacterium]
MKLSTRCRYGTRAMLELARNYLKKPVKRDEISRNEDISSSYLENILISLKSRNLIRTVRGANGGFSLVIAPDKISMYDIVSALEGSIEPVDCIENSNQCTRSISCTARRFWINFHELQVKLLKDTSLQSLLNMETREQIDYSI